LIAKLDCFELRNLLLLASVAEFWLRNVVPDDDLFSICCGRHISITETVELPAFGEVVWCEKLFSFLQFLLRNEMHKLLIESNDLNTNDVNPITGKEPMIG